jgi:hypothetical protein
LAKKWSLTNKRVRKKTMDILIIGVWIACAFIAYKQAQKKGLNTALWAILGLVFGFFGVIASLIARPKNAQARSSAGGLGSPAVPGSAIAGGVAGGAIGSTAGAGMNPGQQNAMKNLQEFAQEKIDEQNEEEDDSGFDAGDMDF